MALDQGVAYRKRSKQAVHINEMQVFLLMSKRDREVFGFTFDPSGANLPEEFAPWGEAGSVSTDTAIDSDVMGVIKRDGQYLFRSGRRTAPLSNLPTNFPTNGAINSSTNGPLKMSTR
jgi:hypothetical protein